MRSAVRSFILVGLELLGSGSLLTACSRKPASAPPTYTLAEPAGYDTPYIAPYAHVPGHDVWIHASGWTFRTPPLVRAQLAQAASDFLEACASKSATIECHLLLTTMPDDSAADLEPNEGPASRSRVLEAVASAMSSLRSSENLVLRFEDGAAASADPCVTLFDGEICPNDLAPITGGAPSRGLSVFSTVGHLGGATFL